MEIIPHLIRPIWLGLPLVLTITWLWHRRFRRSSGTWANHVDPALQRHVLEQPTYTARSNWAPLLPLWLCGFAAAGPSWEQAPQELYLDDDPLFIALDLSQSMLVPDLVPNRLERAKFKLTDLLAAREGRLTALVVFTSAAFVVTPLTNDTKTIQQQLSVLSPKLMPAQGTRFREAYALCLELLQQAGYQEGKLVLIGDDLDEVSLASLAQANQPPPLKLFMLGVGTREGGPVPNLPESALAKGPIIARVDHQRLSEQFASLDGHYIAISDDQQDVRQLIRAVERNKATAAGETSDHQSLAWLDRGPWLLLFCVPWLAYWVQRHLLGLALLTVMMWPFEEVHANDYWWLWETEEQYAQRLLDEGDAKAARAHFHDIERKAYASYLAGKPNETSELLSDLQDARSLYNRGTALARERRLPEALEVLEAAVEADPGNQDAILNRDAVKRALKEQNPQDGDTESAKSEPQQGAEQGDSSPGKADEEAKSPQPENHGQPSEQNPESPQPEQEQLAKAEESKDRSDQRKEPTDVTEPSDAEAESQEADQATEQWLRRIPDDPGGLLRNKFLYQYRRRTDQPVEAEAEPW